MKKCSAKALVAVAVLGLSDIVALSQNNSHGLFTYGLRVGANYASVANLKHTFCSDEKWPAFDLKETRFVTPTVAATVQYRFPMSQVAVDAGIAYSQTRNRIEKNTMRNSEIYDLKMHYAIFNVGAKVYPINGSFAKVSIGVGPCLNGTTCVNYDGTGMTNAARMQIKERLNQSVKGRTLATASLTLGYDFPMGLSLEAYYAKGLTDLVEVSVNNFGFNEERNDSQYVGVGIGWLIAKDGFVKR